MKIDVNYRDDRKERCCCFCQHNIRSGEGSNIECNCELDGHFIGYIPYFSIVGLQTIAVTHYISGNCFCFANSLCRI